MEEGSNGELAFLDTLLKQNNGKISDLYVGSLSTLQYLHQYFSLALTTKQVAKKVLLPHCLIEYIPLSRIQMT